MFRRVATAAAISVLASGLSATSALAAGGTSITADEAKAALTASLSATTAAAAAGYTGQGIFTYTNNSMWAFDGKVDEVHHRGLTVANGRYYTVVLGSGYWRPLNADEYLALRPQLSLLGKRGATQVALLTSDRTSTDPHNWVPSPVVDLQGSVNDTITSATKTVNANDTTYVISATNVGGTAYTYTETFVIGNDGRLLSSSGSSSGGLRSFRESYGYGPQSVPLIPPAKYVSTAQIKAATDAVVHFNARVKARANEVAVTAKRLATRAHRSRVTVADIRAAAKAVANAHRTDLVKVATANVAGGVKLRAVNPATRRPVAFTVTARAGKAVVRAA